MAIAPFQFQYQSPRVAAAPIIDKPTWGPPDVANLAYQSIASIVPTLATAYKAGDKERNLQQGRAAAGELNFGQQATALGQPGGAYGATIPAAPGTNTPTGNLPQFAKIEGASPSANISGLISSTASNYQLAPDYLEKLVQVESKGDPNAMNKGSKASGLGQFIPSTWKQYGNGASPFDPGANLDATARLTLDNANFLRKSLGREPTQGELYLAHQQGAAGAAKLLSNSDARAFDVVPPKHVMSNLPGAMRARASQMTAGEFASLWTNRFGAPAPAFAGPGGAQQQGIQASPAFAQGGPAMNMPQLAPQAAAGAPAPVGMNVPPPDQFASLGGAPQATGISPTQAPAPVPPTPGVQSGAPLFATPGVPMQMPPEAQVAQAPQPAAQAPVQFGQAPQPQMPAPQPQAAPPAMPAPAPAARGGQDPDIMRRIVQAAIGSGDPTLRALAGQFMEQQTPNYGFTNVDGAIYRTDPRTGSAERIAGGAPGQTTVTLGPGDPRRPAALANDPRAFQLNQRTGEISPITPYAGPEDKPAPVQEGMQWNPLTRRYDIPVKPSGSGMFSGNSVEGQALNWMVQNGRLTQDQAADLATGKTITDANGSHFFFNGRELVRASGAAPVPPEGQSGAAPAGAPGTVPGRAPNQLTAPKEQPTLTPEVAARMELSKTFLEAYQPEVEAAVKSGRLSSAVGRAQLASGYGEGGRILRYIDEGSDGLVRMLTGAGMPAEEARRYRTRYMPSATDTQSQMEEKVAQLTRILGKTVAAVGVGKRVSNAELDELRREDREYGQRVLGEKRSPGGVPFQRVD